MDVYMGLCYICSMCGVWHVVCGMWLCGMLGRYALLSPANDDTHGNSNATMMANADLADGTG